MGADLGSERVLPSMSIDKNGCILTVTAREEPNPRTEVSDAGENRQLADMGTCVKEHNVGLP